jgi:hypothetical protein
MQRARSSGAGGVRNQLGRGESMTGLRVIQWTTGKVGKHALRAILDDPRLELVGLYAHSPEKAGRDAGELCDRPNTGIRASADVGALLALDADCVLYAAQVPELGVLLRLLTGGTDVVCTSTFGRTGGLDAPTQGRLEEACTRGRSSLFITGVNPGWINSIAVAMTATCRSVERISISESANVSNYASPETWLAHGMSMPASTPGVVEHMRRSLLPFADTITQMARALDIRLDDLEFHAEHATAAHQVDLGWMCIEKDTLAAVRATWSGVSGGRRRLATSIAWRLTDELNSDWPIAPDHYTLRIDGVPNVDTRIRFVPSGEWHPSDFSILTALPSVNSIPAVCAARPGLLTLRDVGLPYSPVGLWT